MVSINTNSAPQQSAQAIDRTIRRRTQVQSRSAPPFTPATRALRRAYRLLNADVHGRFLSRRPAGAIILPDPKTPANLLIAWKPLARIVTAHGRTVFRVKASVGVVCDADLLPADRTLLAALPKRRLPSPDQLTKIEQLIERARTAPG